MPKVVPQNKERFQGGEGHACRLVLFGLEAGIKVSRSGMGHRDVRNLLRCRKKMPKRQIAFERRDVERIASFACCKRGERYSRNIARKNFARANAGV